MTSIDLTASLERSVAQSEAGELVDAIGKALAAAPEMSDDQAMDAMGKILVEYIVAHRRKPCAKCGHT